MSNSRTVTYKCPYCGKEIEVEVYDSINAVQEPELRDRVISGDLFRVSCPHCKKDFMIMYPLVYMDPDHKFVLWLSEQEVGDTLTSFTEPLVKQGYTLRRVPTIKELTQKIQILEDGISDVMVELAKYDCFIEFVNNKKGRPEDVTSVEYQRSDNGVIKINVRTDDKGMSFLIPVDMMEEEMEEGKDLYQVDDATIPVINDAWIIELFKEPEGNA